MQEYSAKFLKQLQKVSKLEEKLQAEREALQKMCPHVHLDGRSAFPSGISHTDCTICGMSSYYRGRS